MSLDLPLPPPIPEERRGDDDGEPADRRPAPLPRPAGMLGLPAADGTGRRWMITFADLVSLMLTFFILLFAMSTTNLDRWKHLTDALGRQLSPAIEKKGDGGTAEHNIGKGFFRSATNIDYLSGVLERTLADDPAFAGAKVIRLTDRLVVSLPADLLFGGGSALLTERARVAIGNLGYVLKNLNNQIGVAGHSDPAPVPAAFTSNWELSLARANAVANALVRAGCNEKMVAYGLGETGFAELAGPEEQRRRAARRVDVLILANAPGR